MSSAVIPDTKSIGEFDDFPGSSTPATDSNSKGQTRIRQTDMGDGTFNETTENVPPDNRNKSSFATGRKLLRDSVFKGADLNLRRKAIIANIAKTKYSQYSDQRSLKMASADYNQMVLSSFSMYRARMPDLDSQQLRLLAEQDVLKSQGSFKTNAQALASQGGKLAKKGLEKAITAGGNLVLPGLGTVLHFFAFTKLGRILILALCLCCSFLAFEVWQTFASEDKWKTISESANLVHCAGGTEQSAIAKCLFEQKIEEYSQSPDPE